MSVIRSFLFIPGDSEKKLAKAAHIDADAIIIDLEDAVLPQNKLAARKMCADFLKTGNTKAEIWVRINAFDTDLWRDDLESVMQFEPAGIMLPKPDGPADIETLSAHMDRIEFETGAEHGLVKILPVATETARAVTTLNAYPRTHLPRLYGLTWGAEDLATDIGAFNNRSEDGSFAYPFDIVRAQTLFAAKASNVEAVDSLFADFRNPEGLKKYAKNAFEIGFSGMLAIHPAQIGIINKAFTPSAAQLEYARKVLKAFADDPDAGAVSVGGKMLDTPHLKQAQKILTQAKKRE